MKLSRKKLVKIAFKTLEKHPEASAADRGHMLFAACTMPSVALGDWTIDAHCGCLVGTMLLNEGKSQDEIDRLIRVRSTNTAERGSILHDIGFEFDDLLRGELQEKYGEQFPRLLEGFRGGTRHGARRIEITD